MNTCIQRLLKMKEYIFLINVHPPIKKQSNKDWNTAIHLENNGQSITVKVPLNFWFLIMTFNLRFYHQLWVKWVCIHTGNSSEHIGQTHTRFPKCLWMFDTEWNVHRVDIFEISFNKLQPHQHLHLK